ncbi:hypothetical protein FHR99_001412 [Litorivivens lipolytica]|uniref:EthD domain-containing protein n=1 Tax=Litorivivens lipolytica TaxID=1524264 RepID=A0A7W4Z6S8_9GAMM|nr:EthD domain-containing protein [Litorivivens lipolytica]MBB3047176.1 hypothetical protein [Litorivivens lipolytica]
MEKLIYMLWKPENESSDAFRDTMLNKVTPELRRETPHTIRLCVSDSDVAAAAPYRLESVSPAADAIISIWVDSSVYRERLETILAEHSQRFCGYLVTESEPLLNNRYPAKPGARTEGMNQVVFLQKPERLSFDEWIDIWHCSHTKIAIETQSTFGYRQNVVTRALTPDAPPCDAIVEENFPEAAIHGRAAFYDAEGKPELQQEREKVMMESCARFIDFDKIDCIPMSEYLVS